MKRLTLFMIVGVTVITSAVLTSCQKDELIPQNTAECVLKTASSFDLPIFMDQTDEIGFAMIYLDGGNLVHVDVDLDEAYLGGMGIIVREGRLYADEEEPWTNAPGHFPYKVVWPDFDFSFPDLLWDESQDYWYIAIHIDLLYPDGQTGTAWLLPEEGGTNWYNKNNKPKGWGEYFIWYFE